MPFPFRCRTFGTLAQWAMLLCLLAPTLASAEAAVPPPVTQANQLVVVIAADWDSAHGRLQALQRHEGQWRAHGAAFEVALGRNGSAWGIGLHPAQADGPQKKEGDGRSPAGIFTIGDAFGYADHARTALNYRPMQSTSYCIDVADSPLYNRIVDADEVGAEAVEGSTEQMRLDLHNKGDVRYRQGFVIEHNRAGSTGAGSCIFAHLWRTVGEATAGCTAMEPAHMQELLAWLDPDQHPLFVLLTATDYQRLETQWSLPVVGGGEK